MAPLGHETSEAVVIGPLGRVPAARRVPLARVATALSVLLLAMMAVLGHPLRSGVAPSGIVSLQLAASPDVAGAILDSWADVPRARLLWAHGLDLLLPVASAVAIGVGASILAAASRAAAPSATIAAGSALAAAVADQVENAAMWVTILRGPGWDSVLPTLAAATVKFAGLALAIGALTTSAVIRRRAMADAGPAPS